MFLLLIVRTRQGAFVLLALSDKSTRAFSPCSPILSGVRHTHIPYVG